MRTLHGLLLLVLSVLLPACRAAPAAEEPVLGTWIVTALEGVQVDQLEHPPELTLGPDGALSGNSGVNRFRGRADLSALRSGRLLVGPLAGTLMAGPPEAMAVEASFLRVLTQPLEWRRSASELTLSHAGTVVVRLTESKQP